MEKVSVYAVIILVKCNKCVTKVLLGVIAETDAVVTGRALRFSRPGGTKSKTIETASLY